MTPPTAWLFYDGECGFCQRSVRWLLALDRKGRFHFAPLGGETFAELVPEAAQAELPDSIVVRSPTGELATRGEALRTIAATLGPLWWLPWLLLRLTPLFVLNWGYDLIAGERHRLAPAPGDACPVPPKHQRGRFGA